VRRRSGGQIYELGNRPGGHPRAAQPAESVIPHRASVEGSRSSTFSRPLADDLLGKPRQDPRPATPTWFHSSSNRRWCERRTRRAAERARRNWQQLLKAIVDLRYGITSSYRERHDPLSPRAKLFLTNIRDHRAEGPGTARFGTRPAPMGDLYRVTDLMEKRSAAGKQAIESFRASKKFYRPRCRVSIETRAGFSNRNTRIACAGVRRHYDRKHVNATASLTNESSHRIKNYNLQYRGLIGLRGPKDGPLCPSRL